MDDYIKKEDAIQHGRWIDTEFDGYVIEDAKTANVVPVRHGHWILPNKEKTDRPLPECSCCGWYVSEGGVLDFAYCPNCGAKMGGE